MGHRVYLKIELTLLWNILAVKFVGARSRFIGSGQRCGLCGIQIIMHFFMDMDILNASICKTFSMSQNESSPGL